MKTLTTNQKTNKTTQDIIDFLTDSHVFVWRQNTAPIPVQKNGVVTGFRSGGKSGRTDIMGMVEIIPYLIGLPLHIEVKTGKDKLRPEQIGFLKTTAQFGAINLVVSDYADFLTKWQNVLKYIKKLSTAIRV